MNSKLTGYAKQIANLLALDDETAELVFNEMCCSGFDFSASTKRKFIKEAKIALQTIKAI